MNTENKIKCPNCGTAIDVQDVLSHQLEEELKRKFNYQLVEEKKKYENEKESWNKMKMEIEQQTQREKESLQKKFFAQLDNLNKAKEEFEQKKKRENELFQEKIDAKLKEEKIRIKSKLEEEQATQFSELQKELNEKSEQIKELNRSKAEIEKLKREKAELKEAIEAETQKKLNDILLTEKEKIKKFEEEKNELKIKELQKQLDDQKKLTEEMKRKQEQGSMQLQGEVQELAIEEWLKTHFPIDNVEDIKKGARGGDCIQTVNTRTHQNCGTIYYESKRTKDFQAGWIEKFKADIMEKRADIGVLVTVAMPADMERMGLKEGIWICDFEEFKGLSVVLRESLIKLNHAVASQENKGEKMKMLYDYLTSNTFHMQIEAIVDGFKQMRKDLDNEKNAMQRIWKQREKQIEKVTTNTIDIYGSVKGIAGNAVQTVKSLELSSESENESNNFDVN